MLAYLTLDTSVINPLVNTFLATDHYTLWAIKISQGSAATALTGGGMFNPLMGRATDHYKAIRWLVHYTTLAVDGWAVTSGTARMVWAGCGPAQTPPGSTKCNSPPINGQCTCYSMWHCNYLCTLNIKLMLHPQFVIVRIAESGCVCITRYRSLNFADSAKRILSRE